MKKNYLIILLTCLPSQSKAIEWPKFDESVKQQFSNESAQISDHGLFISQIIPFAALARIDDSSLRTKSIGNYGIGSLSNYIATSIVKSNVGRLRPYNFHRDNRVRGYASSRSKDRTRSFYSGHASVSMYSSFYTSLSIPKGTDEKTRGLLIGAPLFIASSTAMLRVTAGQHFYSDIIAGMTSGILFALASHPSSYDNKGFAKWNQKDLGIATLSIALGLAWPNLIGWDLGPIKTTGLRPSILNGKFALSLSRTW